MTILDYILIVVMGFWLVRGYFRGFFRELASLVGIVLGIFLGYYFEPKLSLILKAYLGELASLPLISFIMIVSMCLVFCNCLAWLFLHLQKKEERGIGTHLMGTGLALIKGLIITFLGMVLVTFYLPSQAPLMTKSKIAPIIIRSYQSAVQIFSPHTVQDLKQKMKNTQKKISETVSEKTKEINQKNE